MMFRACCLILSGHQFWLRWGDGYGVKPLPKSAGRRDFPIVPARFPRASKSPSGQVLTVGRGGVQGVRDIWYTAFRPTGRIRA